MLWLQTGTVRGKLILMALITTLVALITTSVCVLIYDVKSFQQGWVDDLTTQAEIIATMSAPAVSFNDQAAARQNLELLRVRPQIRSAAIYTESGLFAAYGLSPLEAPSLPAKPGRNGYSIQGGSMIVYHPIVDNGERVGTVYLNASYRLWDRVMSYAVILASVLVFSLVVAAIVASELQKSITRPLAAVTDVAREVMQRRDFSLRVGSDATGEIATLVAAFNDMLGEVGRRAHALQEANRTLEHEMQVRQGAERALLVADRRKDEFLATLAHELRNPLAPIRTGLDIMRVNSKDAGAVERARTIMERQLKQMVRLVDDLLDVSRITTGKLTIRHDHLVLRDVVNDALELVKPLMELQGHALDVSLPEAPVHLLGDGTRLAQVLSNLLNNAAKYTMRGGAISLSAETLEGQVQIHVKDNGIGIPSHMLGDIFELFIQADTSLERTTAGLGVGLSLARKLVELHGGTIYAFSEGLDKGSEIVVTLPVHAAPAGTQSGRQNEAAPSRTYRILLADDNVDFVNSIGALLRSMGHTVQISHDGHQALVAAEAFVPDFAFLDIGLPRLNGYDLARALRRLPTLRKTVMVAVTGWGQQKDRQHAFEAGFEGHLVKPVSYEQISAILAGSREGFSHAI
jgi:signal transduction histidine kinase/ActR/RegA family two-component response regulator